MSGYQRQREETIHRLAREGWNLNNILRLLRLSQSLQRLAILGYNRELSEREEKQQQRLKEQIVNLTTVNDCTAYTSGDPRGYVVKVKLHSGASNHWGGETWGIPTR